MLLQVLLGEFVKFGPIASVKVMWPRTDEDKARGRMSGFVAFMTRKSAEDARDEMNGALAYSTPNLIRHRMRSIWRARAGRLLHSADLRIGWGKAVPIPAFPIYPPPGGMAEPRGAAVPMPGLGGMCRMKRPVS